MKNYLFEKGQQVLIFPLTVNVNLRGVGNTTQVPKQPFGTSELKITPSSNAQLQQEVFISLSPLFSPSSVLPNLISEILSIVSVISSLNNVKT